MLVCRDDDKQLFKKKKKLYVLNVFKVHFFTCSFIMYSVGESVSYLLSF